MHNRTDGSDDDERSGGLSGRAFMGIALLVLGIGLSIGGAFAIGVQVGQSQTPESVSPPTLAITTDDSFLEVNGDDGGSGSEAGTLGPRGGGILTSDGEIPPEVIEQMRQQGATDDDIAAVRAQVRQFQRAQDAGFPQGRPGFAAGTRDAANTGIGSRITGTIQSIDGNIVTLMTPAGPQRVATIAGTRITVTRSSELDDLSIGAQVAVVAVPGPDQDVLEAASITAVSVDE